MGLYDVINYFNYTPTNSSIDIVVIEHPDGTLHGSPFHVNFGFGSVLRAHEKIVYIEVNDEQVDIQMRLGKSGEAFFCDSNAEIVSPPETPKKEYSRQSSASSSRKHSRASKVNRSKSDRSVSSSDSSLTHPDVFDPSCALSDSEIEFNRPQSSHSAPGMGYLSDPEINCETESESALKSKKDKTHSQVTIWKWGHLPETTSSSTLITQSNSTETIKNDAPEKPGLEKRESQTALTQTEDVPEQNGVDMASGMNSGMDSDRLGLEKLGLGKEMALSLCGGLDLDVTEQHFQKYKVEWETFVQDPKGILENPNLVVKELSQEGDVRYLNWSTCAAIAASKVFFDRQLPIDKLEKLKTPRRNASRSWSIFGFRSSRQGTPAKEQTEPTSETVAAASDETDETNNNHCAKKNVGKTIMMTHDELKKLNLKPGKNKIEFQVVTKFQGTAKTEAAIYLWKWSDKIVVSDIDGTVTKSDVVGHISNVFYIDYTHKGIHNLYHQIEKNGYKFVYVSSRGISQSSMTKTYINWTKKDGRNLPYGPILLNPSSLISALLREVWTKNPEEFKIDCLSGIANLFPESSAPFIAGFGNKTNDEKAYRTVLIPDKRIFTIDKKGVVKSSDSTLSNFSTSYERLEQVVDFFFPPICRSSSSTSLRHLSNTFWRLDLPDIDFDSELAEP